MIREELEKRQLPPVLTLNNGETVTGEEQWQLRRQEIAEVLQQQYCGYEPPLKPVVKGRVTFEDEKGSFGGKAIYQKIDLCSKIYASIPEMRTFTFACHFVRPKHVEKPPVFVYISFSQTVVDELIPMEEILDHGFAIASFYYQDLAPDTADDFRNGIAASYGRNPYDSWGKLRMWAWGASRVMDYLQTLDCIDRDRIAVVGHSRLGKTALIAGAFDTRFSLTISNDSGGAGAAIFRGKDGEMVRNFGSGTSGHWIAGNFKQYAHRENDLPFDMHFLLSMVAPRNLYVCSASLDGHADPKSEFLGCVATSPVYETVFGKDGLVLGDSMECFNRSSSEIPETFEMPQKAFALPEGNIGYHMREGTHYLSRYDWQKFMEYRNMPEHIC